MPLRILANENIPAALVSLLRARGHDTVWAAEDAAAEPDQSVIARAGRESRLLITFDRDFGELAFRSRLPAPSGIVLIRMPQASAGAVAERVTAALESRPDWAGHFSVLEPGRIRMTPLPPQNG